MTERNPPGVAPAPPDFNRVVFRPRIGNGAVDIGNIHFAVHPFYVPNYASLYGKQATDRSKLTPEQQQLADALWDAIPGLNHLYFWNGEITIHHRLVFSNEEIIAAAEALIRPHLEAVLAQGKGS